MPDAKNIHKYPRDKTPGMRKADVATFGDAKKQKTYKGPHLTTGKATQYNQMSLGKGFMAQKPITGHTQQKNVEDNTLDRGK